MGRTNARTCICTYLGCRRSTRAGWRPGRWGPCAAPSRSAGPWAACGCIVWVVVVCVSYLRQFRALLWSRRAAPAKGAPVGLGGIILTSTPPARTPSAAAEPAGGSRAPTESHRDRAWSSPINTCRVPTYHPRRGVPAPPGALPPAVTVGHLLQGHRRGAVVVWVGRPRRVQGARTPLPAAVWRCGLRWLR